MAESLSRAIPVADSSVINNSVGKGGIRLNGLEKISNNVAVVVWIRLIAALEFLMIVLMFTSMKGGHN